MYKNLIMSIKILVLALSANLFLSSCIVVTEGQYSSRSTYYNMSGVGYLLAQPDFVPILHRPSASALGFYIVSPEIFTIEEIVCGESYQQHSNCRMIKQYGTKEHLYAKVRFNTGDSGYIKLTYFDAAPFHYIITRKYAYSRGMTIVEYRSYTIEHRHNYKKSHKRHRDVRIKSIKRHRWNKRVEKLIINRQVSVGMTKVQVFLALNPERNDYFQGERLERIKDRNGHEVWEGGGKAYYFSKGKLSRWEPYSGPRASARADKPKENHYMEEFKAKALERKRLERAKNRQDRYNSSEGRQDKVGSRSQYRQDDKEINKDVRYNNKHDRRGSVDTRSKRVEDRGDVSPSKGDSLRDAKRNGGDKSQDNKAKQDKKQKVEKKNKVPKSKEYKRCIAKGKSKKKCKQEEEKRVKARKGRKGNNIKILH